MNPFVFVVGCPRSGTTLLQRMLDAHPDLAVTNDTHFIPRVIGDGETSNPMSAALVDRVLSYHRFRRLGVGETTTRQLAIGARTYPEFVGRLYDHVAASQGKRNAGEKTPDYVRHLSLLHQLFPHAKVVHIIRDGRDVALSALDWARPDKGPGRFALWQTAPVAVCALWWARFVLAGRIDGEELGAAFYHEVRYETLVAQPETVLRSVTTFLGLPFDDGMLRFSDGRQSTNPALSAKAGWRPPTPGLRSWEKSMDFADVAIFESLVGDVLRELGYVLTAQSGSPDRVTQAATWRAQWLAELAERGSLDRAALVLASVASPRMTGDPNGDIGL